MVKSTVKKIVRADLYLTDELKEWYRVESDRVGMNMSTYMVMVLREYSERKQNEEALKALKTMSADIPDGNVVKLLTDLTEQFKAITEKLQPDGADEAPDA